MKAYAYQNRPEVVERSASGGAFSGALEALARLTGEAPAAAGAAWTPALRVRHRLVENPAEYALLSGSKYLQSEMGDCFARSAEALAAGKWLLFTGTPCQIHALKLYILRHGVCDERLYTADVICHGAPPAFVWRDYLAWLEKKRRARVVSVSFRDKARGWKGYHMRVRLSDGRELGDSYAVRCYLRMYFSLLILQRRCFACPHATPAREADLTLGDFWGIERVLPDFPVGKGVSLVLASTPKGERLAEAMRAGGADMRACAPQACLAEQANLTHPHKTPEAYARFWADYRAGGFSRVIARYGFYTPARRLRHAVGRGVKILLGRR